MRSSNGYGTPDGGGAPRLRHEEVRRAFDALGRQPESLARALEGRLVDATSLLEEAGLGNGEIAGVERIVVVGEGSALHAGLLACYAIEEWARIPARAESAGEWADHAQVLDGRTLVIGLAPGHDPDGALAALRLARSSGARTLSVSEHEGEAQGPTLLTRAAQSHPDETFTSFAALLLLLALRLGEARGEAARIDPARVELSLAALPEAVARGLGDRLLLDRVALRHRAAPFFFFLGRLAGLATCLEGALQVRLHARMPTEAYAAGEMKHGPIALIDEGTPVVCVVTPGQTRDKILSNLEETRARGAHVIAIAVEDDPTVGQVADEILFLPAGEPFVQSVAAVVPLQLLARGLAALRLQSGVPLLRTAVEAA